ncbi:MAG TPA: potassium channel family protein [Bryobacteraceae bacterium]|nr:potassium channel family protein [Bryobacteraceae bacterium]
MHGLTIGRTAIAAALVAGTVAIHSFGSFYLFWRMDRKKRQAEGKSLKYSRITLDLTGVVLSLLLLHVVEVSLWAGFYTLAQCLPNFGTAAYFSLVTYATVGYGDVVLVENWRLLAGVEGLAGILMTSWSTAILIANVQWVYTILHERWEKSLLEKGSPKGSE